MTHLSCVLLYASEDKDLYQKAYFGMGSAMNFCAMLD